jgi:hypothetical protein
LARYDRLALDPVMRIVLLAADGTATRAIGSEVGCTTGKASKWRVRFCRASP